MIYTKQEKQKLEQVISVFAERLKESDAFDLAWSDKVGYVLLDISRIMTMWIARGALKRQKNYADSCWRTLRWMCFC